MTPAAVRSFAGEQGLLAFNDALVDTLVAQRVEGIRDSASFGARLMASEVAGVGLVDARVSAVRSTRRASTDDDDGSVFVLLSRHADGWIEHRRGRERIARDRIVVVPAGESFEVAYAGTAEVTFVVLPPGVVGGRYDGLRGPIRSRPLTSVGLAVASVVRSVVAGAGDAGEHTDEALGRILVGALDALAGDGLVDESSRLRLAIERMIDDDLENPRLGVPWLARRLAVSPRTLQRAFSAYGESISTRIRERRLDRAAELLRSRPDLTATEVGALLGFATPSQFGAAFRARFGAPPSAWRASEIDLSSPRQS
ncbi:helix-turn-helix domain-containing protein [Homoserinibacter sp. GY 40078]|uniref:AraC family transcriptional regulator n=1 Tax=Homoserinibacter sp. GY 40078 TaxID=2603275 RepID=UPI0011C8DFE3|nr:helix-turn-helix domain-containing protein [Homoserinibacter sp. GY 40078]TXK17457.1 AraC family transcriptional regulator [Homoserinibacter sp. GY 40078]